MVSPDAPPKATGSKPRIFACSSVALDYFRFLCESLAASATRVIEVAPVAEDHYRRSARGSGMTRLRLRLQMYVMYPLRLFVSTFQARRGDLFVVTSNTFFAPMLVAFLVRWRGVRVVHLLYDLFPDAMEVSGAARTEGLLARSLGAVTWANQHLTDGTVYLGDFLRDYAERRWGRTRRPGVVPIATDVRLYTTPVPVSVVPAPLVMHYGGQLGRLHDVDSLVESLRQLSRAGLLGKEVAFEGLVSGARAIALEDALRGMAGATVGGTLSSHEWRRHVQSCQIGIVTLSPGGATVCLPSKTYAMMAAGLAVIAVCPAWSDLATLVRETGGGWVVDNAARRQPLAGSDYLTACRSQRPTADVAADFEGLVSRLVASPHEVLKCRRNAWKAVRERFSPDRISQAWVDYLRPLLIAGRNA
jgi:glycosyltransferase involved in cell wall biosynthesis